MSKNQIVPELNLRRELVSILEDSLASTVDIELNKIGIASESNIDSLITEAHLKSIVYENSDKSESAKVDLIHLVRIKQSIETDTLKSSNDIVNQKVKYWKNLLDDQNLEIEDLETRLEMVASNEKLAAKKKSKENKNKPDKTFDQSGIVRQIISASLESGNQYKISAEIDNKQFEDRKAFMIWPLVNSKKKKRYSSSKKYMLFNSANPEVNSISQAKVIYSKKLSNKSYTIVLMHDNNYYSVYSNLKSANVTYGQTVSYNQSIGNANGNDSGQYELRFEIWKNKKSIDPNHWLKNG